MGWRKCLDFKRKSTQSAKTMMWDQNNDRWTMHHESQNVCRRWDDAFAYTAEPDHLRINKNKPSTWCWSLLTNLWQFCPSSFSMRSWAPVQHWPRYSHGWAVWSGLDLHPSQPPPYSPGHQATTTGNVSHPFSRNLLTVCPLPSICSSMSNSAF